MSREDSGEDVDTRPVNPPPLAHRTDRLSMRNEKGTPVIFVDDDPLGTGPIEDQNLQNQRTPLDVDTVAEAKDAIRLLADRFEADTGQRWYYAIAGERAQVSGNGMGDYFDALAAFRTTYADLEDQLEAPGEFQRRGYPENHMRVTAAAVTCVDGVWLRFITSLLENDEGEQHLGSSLWVTTMQHHGPLVSRWLNNVLDIGVVGAPERVERQHCVPQKRLGLSDEPRETPKQLRMIGVSGERENGDGGEYISCGNPCYDPTGEYEMYDQLRGGGVNNGLIRLITEIDRLPVRVCGGTHGTDEDLYVGSHVDFTEIGQTDGVVLVSGKTHPIRKEEYGVEEDVSGAAGTGTRTPLDRLLR